MDRMHNVAKLFIKNQNILSYIVVCLLTFGSEHILSAMVFQCPCNSWNMVYGCVFLLVPALILLLLSFMVNARIWRLWTGKYCPKKDDQFFLGGFRACFCQVLLPMTAKALVAPLIWIAVALLGANFYECAATGMSTIQSYYCKDNGTDCRNLLLQVPCDEKPPANFSSEWSSLRAQSQVIGWSLIASIIAVALILKCFRRRFSPVSYLQLRFLKIYIKKEDELFEKKSKEHATNLAERNTKCFFETTDPAPSNTPSNEDWQMISATYTLDSDVNYYSKLHEYLKTKGGVSPSINEENQNRTDSGNRNEAESSV